MVEHISAGAAAIGAVIALAAVYFARVQARSAAAQTMIATRQTELQQRIHEESAQPYVWADIRPHPQHGQLFQLLLKNEGPTVASNVTVKFDPPLEGWRGADRTSGPRMDGGGVARFESLPPGRVMSWHLGLPSVALKEGPTRFVVTIDGTGPFGELERLRYAVDLEDYEMAATTVTGTLYGVSESIKKANSSLDGITKKIGEISHSLRRE